MQRITIRGLILTLAVISFSTARAQDTAATDLYSPASGETTAVLIGTLELERSILGHTVDGKLRYMRVFVNHDGRWRLLSGSFSPVVHPSVLYGEPE